MNNKLSPWKMENLDRIYNRKRFPKRKKREPKKLRIFNFIGNISIMICFLYFYHTKYRRGAVVSYAEIINKYVDIPIKTIVVKVSQLKKFDLTGDGSALSYDLINVFNDFRYSSHKELLKILKEHNDNTFELLENKLEHLKVPELIIEDPFEGMNIYEPSLHK